MPRPRWRRGSRNFNRLTALDPGFVEDVAGRIGLLGTGLFGDFFENAAVFGIVLANLDVVIDIEGRDFVEQFLGLFESLLELFRGVAEGDARALAVGDGLEDDMAAFEGDGLTPGVEGADVLVDELADFLAGERLKGLAAVQRVAGALARFAP